MTHHEGISYLDKAHLGTIADETFPRRIPAGAFPLSPLQEGQLAGLKEDYRHARWRPGMDVAVFTCMLSLDASLIEREDFQTGYKIGSIHQLRNELEDARIYAGSIVMKSVE